MAKKKNYMNVNGFANWISALEGGVVNLSIAQIKEVISKTRKCIKEETGVDIYSIIRKIHFND